MTGCGTRWRWGLILPLLWAGAILAQPAFRALVYDLRAVLVENGPAHGDLPVTLDRVIRRDANLRWSVLFIDADTGERVFSSSEPVPLPYSRAVGQRGQVIRRNLAWLIGGQGRVSDAVSAGFGPGRWTIRVCHEFRFGWGACRDSNTFTITEGG